MNDKIGLAVVLLASAWLIHLTIKALLVLFQQSEYERMLRRRERKKKRRKCI